ncbi:hypothetical protein BT69DRAFT_1276336 [Atractiella rhizophila]|nr:hypothetical protein BT69DRAFT_1276336 [Atractiella rhizophila]
MYLKEARHRVLSIIQRFYSVLLVFQFLLLQGSTFHTHVMLVRILSMLRLELSWCQSSTKSFRFLMGVSAGITLLISLIHQLEPPNPLYSKRSIIIDFITQVPMTNRLHILLSDLVLGLVQLIFIVLCWDFHHHREEEEEDVANPFKKELFVLRASDVWERVSNPKGAVGLSTIPSMERGSGDEETLPLHALRIRTSE